MGKWRKKPVVVEAEVYKPGMEDGSGCNCSKGNPLCSVSFGCKSCDDAKPYIQTIEGRHYISPGDYIITGVKGERYPCKPDTFELTYEPVGAADGDTGAELIAKERQRQIEKECFTTEHDLQHKNEELVKAAICYLYQEDDFIETVLSLWPWSMEDYNPGNYRVRTLTKAGALIAAEIDRLAALTREGRG